MPVVEVECRHVSSRAIPQNVTPAAVQRVANVQASVQLTPVSCGSGEASWTFTAEDHEDLVELVEEGLLVFGERLTLARVQRQITLLAVCETGNLANFTNAAEFKEMVETMSGKSITIVPNALAYTFQVASQADADAIVAASPARFKDKVSGMRHQVALRVAPSGAPPQPFVPKPRILPPPQPPAPVPRTSKILIFHDAENCPIPRGIFGPDAFGKPQLVSQNAPPEQHIDVFTLRDMLLRQVLACVRDPSVEEPGRLQELKYEWNFVLQYNPQNAWHPHQQVMEDLYQIASVWPPGTRSQAVDVKLKALLKQVEKIYRDCAQEEKDRTLVVLISGDRDFVDDVRELRQSFMQKPGLRVVVVFSANNPPRQALLDAVGDRRLALGIWQQLVDDSRGRRLGGSKSPVPAEQGPEASIQPAAKRRPQSTSGPAPHPGGTAAKRRPSRESHRRPTFDPFLPLPPPPVTASEPVLPRRQGDLIEIHNLKPTFASFLNQQPQVLAPLKEEVSQLNPALVIELQSDWKARSHNMRLRIVTGGRLAQPSRHECDQAAQRVQFFVGSLLEAKLSDLKGLNEDERQDGAVAAPLPGVSGEELRQNPQLSAISRQCSVMVFIPGLSQARMRKLKGNELFIVAGNTAEVTNDEIIGLCWERYKVTCQVDRSSAPPVVVIDPTRHSGAALSQAKKLLTTEGLFSENPTVHSQQQQHQMTFSYPSNWKKAQLVSFLQKHNLDFVATESPKVKKPWATVAITCSGATRSVLLQLSKAPKRVVKCADCLPVKASTERCSVILVYQRGNEQGRDAVWNWLLSLTNKTEEFQWPGNVFIEKELMKKNWPVISAGIRDLGVKLSWKQSAVKSKVKVSGPADAVNNAVGKLQDEFNRIVVVDLGTAQKKGCQHLDAAVLKLLEDLTTRVAQKASGDKEAEDSDEEGTQETGSTTVGSQGAQPLRSSMAFIVQDTTKSISLAHFAGDEDLVQSIKEELAEFLANYVEREWPLPKKCDQAALDASYAREWKTTIAQKMGLTDLEWTKSAQGGHVLRLCGPLTNVEDAMGVLKELFVTGPKTELLVSIDFVPKALLKMKYHKVRRSKIIQEAWDKFKTVRILQSSDRALRCVGEGGKTPDLPGPVHLARDYLEQRIREFAEEQAQEKLELTSAELDFLQGEGKELLRNMQNRGCFYRFEQQSKSRLAQARLVTGCDLEVWKADAVVDFPDVQALVNSANERLAHGGGIAADIAREAGPGLDGECKQLLAAHGGSLDVAEVVVTGAYDLGERGYSFILHAVAPRYPADGSEMEATMSNILAAASARRVESLALPLLGAGIFGWPLERAVGHIFAALGKWAQAEAARSEAERSSLKRIVLVDLIEERATAAADRLRELVEEPAPSSPQVPDDLPPVKPEHFLPKIPTYAWYWNDSTVPFSGSTIESDGKWIAYDYDQVMQLEKGMEEGQLVVELNGDVLGQASDSTCILEGRKHATYEVHLDKIGEGHDAIQYNQKENPVYGFKFPRAVKKVKIEDVDDAFAKIGLLEERYEKAQASNRSRWTTYQEELAAYQLRQAEVQQTPSQPGGGWFSSLIAFFNTSPTPEPAAEADPAAAEVPAAVGAKVFLPASSSRLLLIGPPQEVPQVRDQVVGGIQAAYKVSSKPLALGQDMRREGMRDSILQHLADCDLGEVEVDIAEGGLMTLRALGEKSLLKAEREIAEWQAMQAWRSSQVQFPSEWTESSKKNADKPGALFIEVDPETEEYKLVERRMRDVVSPNGVVRERNAFTNRLLKVERVENPMAFRAYESRCRVLQAAERNRGNANELWVKHGTGQTDPVTICEGEGGLDYRYSAWGMFGRAAYTAEDATYSDSSSYRHEITLPDGTTQRQMILCRVAAGCIKEETHEAGVTDKFIKPPQGFDSVRGDVIPGTGSFAIMVYAIDQAYPAYLITYQP